MVAARLPKQFEERVSVCFRNPYSSVCQSESQMDVLLETRFFRVLASHSLDVVVVRHELVLVHSLVDLVFDHSLRNSDRVMIQVEQLFALLVKVRRISVVIDDF